MSKWAYEPDPSRVPSHFFLADPDEPQLCLLCARLELYVKHLDPATGRPVTERVANQ